MKLTIDLENVSSCDEVPDNADIHRWVATALAGIREEAELSVRIVSEAESESLNSRYRNKSGPTNVLSFPADLPDSVPLPLLGDLVICAPVVLREAIEQHKNSTAHWAHMLVHGTLHLVGYDHIDDRDAEKMEQLETAVLTGLGFPPPYDEQPREEQTS